MNLEKKMEAILIKRKELFLMMTMEFKRVGMK